MRTLLCLVVALAPFLGACASFGVGNPQAEWTTTEGVGNPPVSNIEAPETPVVPVDVWVPYVPVDPPHHRENEHVAATGGSPQARGGTHPASHAAPHTGGSSPTASHPGR